MRTPTCFFDLETTGLIRGDVYPDIVECCFMVTCPNGVVGVDTFETRVFTSFIPAEATNIHHITTEDVKDCPTFEEIAPRIYSLLNGRTWCGHNIIGYDSRVLIHAFTSRGIEPPSPSHVIDTLLSAREIIPGMTSYALGALCEHFNISTEGAHSAEGDVRQTHCLWTCLRDHRTTPEEQYKLGMKHLQLPRTAKTCERAIGCFMRAAESDHLESVYELGRLFFGVTSPIRDAQRGIEYLKRAARGGHALAAYKLGVIYSMTPEHRNLDEALVYLTNAVDGGCREALVRLAAIHPDPRKSVEYYVRDGSPYAHRCIGFLYQHESEEHPRNDELAFEYFKRAADRGDSIGAKMTSRCFFSGVGTPVSAVQGDLYFRRYQRLAAMWADD